MRLKCFLITAFFTLLARISLAPAAVVEERFDNGKIKSHYNTNDKGVRAGAYTLYFDTGRVQETGYYRNGELNGLCQKNFESGKLQERSSYTDGKLDGPETEFDDKGNLVRAAQYRKGVLNGVYQELAGGQVVVERVYIGGQLIYPRSPMQIRRTLAGLKHVPVVTTQPTDTVPQHVGTNESQQDREQAIRILQAYRYLCLLPYENLMLDPMDNAHDEAATVLLQKIGHLDHVPKNPGMPDDDYHFAYKGTSTSNLYEGGGGSAASVGAYIHEDGLLGHRRWCLNPPMGKTGFAYAKSFSAMWAMDGSNHDVPDYDFVAFPAPGYFPSTYFATGDTWSVSLNPSKYRKPDKSDVTVTVTPARASVADAKVQKIGQELPLVRLDVDQTGYGIANCIIFKPRGIETRDGSAYLVEIKGLKNQDGEPADVQYLVDFFKP